MKRIVICIEIKYYPHILERLSETSMSFMIAEVKGKIYKVFEGHVWICQIRSDLFACVVNHNSFSPIHAAENIKRVVQPFSEYCKVAIGIGKTVKEIGELHVSYGHALAKLQLQSPHPGVEICSEENISDDELSRDGFLSINEVNRIFNFNKAKEYDGLLKSVCDLLEDGIEKNLSTYQAKNLCKDILNTWIRAVESERNDLSLSLYSELFEKLDRSVTWAEIKGFFEEAHLKLFQMEQGNDRNDQFAEVLDYIREHYNQDLSIQYFAGQLGMSAGHFSRVFKEVVGEKYVEYVAELRITNAKQLLRETNKKIDDIAEEVGYFGRNSFIRVFRKYEGVTPGKYRILHQIKIGK